MTGHPTSTPGAADPNHAPVWDALVGQADLIATLSRAASDAGRIVRGEPGQSMTHAWLLTGPPGSGRSTAAMAFAAALQCADGGCGHCPECAQTRLRSHPDIEHLVPETLQITAEDARELVRRAALTPMRGRWNVMVIEDADRLNEISGNALLKAIEEPSARTVWVLCAPTPDDVLPTIVSRARHVRLRTPALGEVADALIAEGSQPAIASFAARAAQGHIGRARALARDEEVRIRRSEVLAIPGALRDLPACFTAAQNLLETATADAGAICDALDAEEREALARSYGQGATGTVATRLKRALSAATKEMERRQKSRRTRTVRDQVDRALLDLISLYRDVLVVQTGADVELVNDEMRPTIQGSAVHSGVPATMARLDALDHARRAIGASVAPSLALEALMVRLARGS